MRYPAQIGFEIGAQLKDVKKPTGHRALALAVPAERGSEKDDRHCKFPC
jgi:hypothetical protein